MRGQMHGRRPHMHGGVPMMGEMMHALIADASGPPEEVVQMIPGFGMGMRRVIDGEG